MSRFKLEELHTQTIQGFNSIFGPAWHRNALDIEAAKAAGQVYEGAIPPEVAHRLVSWTPVSFKIETLVDPVTMETYTVDDKYRTVVCNPNTHEVLNIAGDGYAVNLHNVMREAIEAAMDAECDIAGAICLGGGRFLNLSFKPREAVTVGGFQDGAIALVAFNSSLTSEVSTSMQTSSVLAVCDNTMVSQRMRAVNALNLKRTRNSESKITPSVVREALDLSFAETQALTDELEALANIEVTDEQFRSILDLWAPLPEEEGRGRTMKINARGELSMCMHRDTRQVFGQTVAGLWQAHNTYQHWVMGSRGDADRFQRQAFRSAKGEVSDLDMKFMDIVRSVIPEAELALAVK
jgi:hypothetical protein